MIEGLIPQCVWHNGRRYWNADDINALIVGCPTTNSLDASSVIKKFSRRPAVLDLVFGVFAFVVIFVTR